MGDWKLLRSLLEEVYTHSTIVGKIWLTILFIFRMLVLGVAAEDVWDDEQRSFICNTEQPGCRNVCYDRAFPISLIRYWVLQVVFVSVPSLVYMGHVLYRLGALEKERKRCKARLKQELREVHLLPQEYKRVKRELRRVEEHRRVVKAPLRGSLLRTYVFHIIMRSVVEVGFMAGQYTLYGVGLEPLYKCERIPCPNEVDCFVSRPTEKNIFMFFMMAIAGVSLLLNLLEISHLGVRTIKRSFYGKDGLDYHSFPETGTNWEGQQALVRTASLLCENEPLIEEMLRRLSTEQRRLHPVCVPPAVTAHGDRLNNVIPWGSFQTKRCHHQNPKQPCQPGQNDIKPCVLKAVDMEQYLAVLKTCNHLCRSNALHGCNSSATSDCQHNAGTYPMAAIHAGHTEIPLHPFSILNKQRQPRCSEYTGEAQGEPCIELWQPPTGKEWVQRSNSVPLITSSKSEFKAPLTGDCPFMMPGKLNLPSGHRAKRQAASDLVV